MENLLAVRVGIAIEQRLGRHDHARRTETTLDRAFVDEGLLDRVENPSLSQALDGHHFPAVGFVGEHETGADRLVVEQDSTGAALTFAAAILGASKADLVADDLEQRAMRVDQDVVRIAVDRYVQLPLHPLPPFSAQE